MISDWDNAAETVETTCVVPNVEATLAGREGVFASESSVLLEPAESEEESAQSPSSSYTLFFLCAIPNIALGISQLLAYLTSR